MPREKIYNKAQAWHKHGKHKGGLTEVITTMNRKKKKAKFEPIDLNNPDWSKRS